MTKSCERDTLLVCIVVEILQRVMIREFFHKFDSYRVKSNFPELTIELSNCVFNKIDFKMIDYNYWLIL